jgi:septal ring factor EnvC (AmiA/AmiB activator)
MSGDLIHRLARRAIVLGATIAVVGMAIGTVRVAADWRAADAPLDVAPVGLDTINAQLVSEQERTGALTDEIGSVATQIADLQAALTAANGQVAGDTDSAESLQAALAAAQRKLKTLQGQLEAAQERLSALNRAAARQAALNQVAKSSGGGDRDGDDDDEDEHDDD